MRSILLLLVPLLLVAAAPPDAAGGREQRSGTGAPSDQIVITGKRMTTAEAHRVAAEFVKRTAVVGGDRSLARWQDPVCRRAFGLDARYAAIVEAKIRSVAEAASIAVAREPCRPNIAVTFALSAPDVVQKIAALSPARLGEVGDENGLRSVTEWDLAFLKSLYKLPIAREGRQQRGLLVAGMVAAAQSTR
jgi:hypothetical protein